MKYDKDKSPIHLVPSSVITDMADVFGFGAKKYGENNWRDDLDTTSWSRTYSSIQRHLNSFWSGEDLDPESGFSHLQHAATQIAILMEQTKHAKVMDDRYIVKTESED